MIFNVLFPIVLISILISLIKFVLPNNRLTKTVGIVFSIVLMYVVIKSINENVFKIPNNTELLSVEDDYFYENYYIGIIKKYFNENGIPFENIEINVDDIGVIKNIIITLSKNNGSNIKEKLSKLLYVKEDIISIIWKD